MIHNTQTHSRGYMVITVLVFGAVFVTLMLGLSGFVLVQQRATEKKEQGEQALQIAEAGLEYYRWYLSHFENDVTDGTGESGPYEHTYSDPEGGVIGAFSLNITGNISCGEITSIDIYSTGWVDEDPDNSRTVYGKYTRPSVAEYAYILNDNVWAGGDRQIYGQYHANGGIRMDGTNHSMVTSALEEWTCTSGFDCVPSRTESGVFGDGNDTLWAFPVEPVDFTGISLDLAHMKDRAQHGGGLYFPKVSNWRNREGYQVIFRSNGTVDIYEVTSTGRVSSDPVGRATGNNYEEIRNRSFEGNYTIPADCGLLFFEDNVWIEGTVSGKVTVVSANVIETDVDPNVYIIDDIEYASPDGSHGLTLIGEHSTLIAYDVPYTLDLSGVFIAQKGSFGRNRYSGSYSERGTLTINGSIVSNGRVGTKWDSSYCYWRPTWSWPFVKKVCVENWSGFGQRNNSYDRQLAADPPPFTPYMDDEYRFVQWRQEK
ncbi:MAG: hypothetical protein H8D63_01995 [Parcubacteria group bacterium]|nr:hypothetical protein [Parcubacteria group bacterium]